MPRDRDGRLDVIYEPPMLALRHVGDYFLNIAIVVELVIVYFDMPFDGEVFFGLPNVYGSVPFAVRESFVSGGMCFITGIVSTADVSPFRIGPKVVNVSSEGGVTEIPPQIVITDLAVNPENGTEPAHAVAVIGPTDGSLKDKRLRRVVSRFSRNVFTIVVPIVSSGLRLGVRLVVNFGTVKDALCCITDD